MSRLPFTPTKFALFNRPVAYLKTRVQYNGRHHIHSFTTKSGDKQDISIQPSSLAEESS